jgi:serine/threonine protein kinase
MTEPASNHQSELIGQRIGNYIIEELLGTGGMGQVFRARHALLDRLVAFKLMHSNLAKDPQFQARFRQEARSAAALRHPHIVEVFDFDEQDGFAYLVMELITGGSLRTLLQAGGRDLPDWTLADGIELVREAADALAYAHALDMVHRDIKPDNLLLQPGQSGALPTLKVGDFGLARIGEGSGLTAANTAMGTPAYMSPEQCQGRDLDGRSDIYALGVVLFEVATGRLPFEIKTVSEAVFKHVYTPPTMPRSIRPELPEALELAILRCLEKSPAKRFASAADLAATLREINGLQSSAGMASSMLFSSIPAPSTDSGQDGRPAGQVPHVSSLPGGASLPRIQVLDQSGTLLQVVAVQRGGISVGRMPTSDLQLDAPNISRNHLRIEWDGQRVQVVDLGSRSGTQLGDRMLVPQQAQEWAFGTMLRLGPYWLRVEAPATSSQPISRPPAPVAVVSGIMNSFVSSGQLSVAVDQEVLQIVPGRPATIEATITNLAAEPDQVALSVSGIPATWVAPAPLVQIPANGQVAARLSILVPESIEARAGEYPVEVRARSRQQSADGGSVLTRWSIQPFAQTTLALAPSRVETRGRARTHVTIRNEGNAPMTYRLQASDSSGDLTATFDEDQVTVEPGEAARVGLRLEQPIRLLGADQQTTVEVRTLNTLGSTPTSAQLQFRHIPLLPRWALPVSGAGLALAAVFALTGGAFDTLFGAGDTVTPTRVAIAQTQGIAETLAPAATVPTTEATILASGEATSVALTQAVVPTQPDALGATETPAPAETPGSSQAGGEGTAAPSGGGEEGPSGAEGTPAPGQETSAAQPGATQTGEALLVAATQTARPLQTATSLAATRTAVINQGIAQQSAIPVTQTAEAQAAQQTSVAEQQILTQTASVQQTSAVATATAQARTEVISVSFEPAANSVVATGSMVMVRVAYYTGEPAGVHILAAPFTGSSASPGAVSDPPAVSPFGSGTATTAFTLSDPGTVDRVRIQIQSASNGALLYETFLVDSFSFMTPTATPTFTPTFTPTRTPTITPTPTVTPTFRLILPPVTLQPITSLPIAP